MIDFIIAVIIIAFINVTISPLGAAIRWLYDKRRRPFKYYKDSYTKGNVMLAILFLLVLYLIVWNVFFG
jgi:hypothetical protein